MAVIRTFDDLGLDRTSSPAAVGAALGPALNSAQSGDTVVCQHPLQCGGPSGFNSLVVKNGVTLAGARNTLTGQYGGLIFRDAPANSTRPMVELQPGAILRDFLGEAYDSDIADRFSTGVLVEMVSSTGVQVLNCNLFGRMNEVLNVRGGDDCLVSDCAITDGEFNIALTQNGANPLTGNGGTTRFRLLNSVLQRAGTDNIKTQRFQGVGCRDGQIINCFFGRPDRDTIDTTGGLEKYYVGFNDFWGCDNGWLDLKLVRDTLGVDGIIRTPPTGVGFYDGSGTAESHDSTRNIDCVYDDNWVFMNGSIAVVLTMLNRSAGNPSIPPLTVVGSPTTVDSFRWWTPQLMFFNGGKIVWAPPSSKVWGANRGNVAAVDRNNRTAQLKSAEGTYFENVSFRHPTDPNKVLLDPSVRGGGTNYDLWEAPYPDPQTYSEVNCERILATTGGAHTNDDVDPSILTTTPRGPGATSRGPNRQMSLFTFG